MRIKNTLLKPSKCGRVTLFLFAWVVIPGVTLAQEKTAKIDALMSRYHEHRQFQNPCTWTQT